MKANQGRSLLRVTSLGYETEEAYIFRAVAVNGDGDRVSAKKYYHVKVHDSQLPVLPYVGQIWKIHANKTTTKEVVRGGSHLTEVFIIAKSARLVVPETENLFTRFIANEPHFLFVGDRLARKLWIRFGTKIYELLDNKDAEKLKFVRGITDKAAKGLISGWERYENLKQIAWFDKHNIPSGIARNIIKFHKANAIQAIEADPYKLINFGLKFAEVDRLALSRFEIKLDDYIRLQGAVEEALFARTREGHTVSKHSDLASHVYSLLGSQELTAKALKGGYQHTAFILSKVGLYHSVGQWIMEQTVARRFAKLASRTVWSHHYEIAVKNAIEVQGFTLTDKQKQAVHIALSHGLSIISGGAGTGKTTVLKAILHAYQSLKIDVRAIAVSGRAVKRIGEATGYPARTIAGFLKEIAINPLGDRTLIIIDEASMLDLASIFNLIGQTSPRVRFLLVGDPKQLAPISAGLVLHEMVGIVPTVTLDIVKRQKESTGIPEFTQQIIRKVIPDSNMFNSNIVFHNCAKETLNEYVTNLYCQQPVLHKSFQLCIVDLGGLMLSITYVSRLLIQMVKGLILL